MDTIACLIEEIEYVWSEGKLGAYLFIDIKRVFDHVIRHKLIDGF